MQLAELLVPADQRRQRRREAGLRTQALQWRELPGQAGGDQLVDMLRRLDVLEPVPAQVTHGHPGGQPGLRKLPCRVGQHYLAAMRSGRDPRRPVHVEPDIAVLVPGRLTRVQAHPDPHGDAARPVMPGQGALAGHAAADRIPGRLEHDEKAVALGTQLPAPVGQERGAQQSPLRRQRLGVAVSHPAQERRRPLDVAEQQRHGPGGKLPHYASPWVRRMRPGTYPPR